MTSQPQPGPGEGNSAGQILRAAARPRGVRARRRHRPCCSSWRSSGSFRTGRTSSPAAPRAASTVSSTCETIFMPLAAVLLALLVQPRHPKARLIVLAALVEYAVAAFFGVFFGLLIGLINTAAGQGARAAFEGLLLRLAWLALLAVAGVRAVQDLAEPLPDGSPQAGCPARRLRPAAVQPAGHLSGPAGIRPAARPAVLSAGRADPAARLRPAGRSPSAGRLRSAGRYGPPAGYGPPTYGRSAPNPSWNQAPAPPHPGARRRTGLGAARAVDRSHSGGVAAAPCRTRRR